MLDRDKAALNLTETHKTVEAITKSAAELEILDEMREIR